MINADTSCPPNWDAMIVSSEIDSARPVKVICIGAGVGGIITGIRLPQHLKNLDLVIYDKNPEVGGTWYENRYPGVRCDIPSHAYQLTFEPNTQWSEFYATGPEIQRYLVSVAKKHNVHRFCKFRRLFTAATWHEDEGKWEVVVKNLDTHEDEVDTCDVLITSTGLLNKWDWPKIPGLENFKGVKAHSANYDPSTILKDKEVALIGGGSTGIQILPAIQPIAKRVDHYMKGKNWIAPMSIGSEELTRRNATGGNIQHSQEELDRLKDPEEYLKFRHAIEGDLMKAPWAVFHGKPQQKIFHEMCETYMVEKLARRPEILKTLKPTWSPGCRRLTPGPGYLEACCEDNVDFISAEIKQVHEDSIETVDGKIRKVDVIICATGFDVSFQHGPKITGRGGKELNKIWTPTPEAYLSVCPPSMPNMFIFFGPNGGPMTGSAMLMLENVGDFITKAVAKLQREHYKSMVVKDEANNAFSRHIDRFFQHTVFSEPCNAWSKAPNGRLVGNWPGSGVHALTALENPRWEDFDYDNLPETEENCMAWLGNGMTVAQVEDGFTTGYLDDRVRLDRPTPASPDVSVDTPRGFGAVV